MAAQLLFGVSQSIRYPQFSVNNLPCAAIKYKRKCDTFKGGMILLCYWMQLSDILRFLKVYVLSWFDLFRLTWQAKMLGKVEKNVDIRDRVTSSCIAKILSQKMMIEMGNCAQWYNIARDKTCKPAIFTTHTTHQTKDTQSWDCNVFN